MNDKAATSPVEAQPAREGGYGVTPLQQSGFDPEGKTLI